jgi:hypothetical protein
MQTCFKSTPEGSRVEACFVKKEVCLGNQTHYPNATFQTSYSYFVAGTQLNKLVSRGGGEDEQRAQSDEPLASLGEGVSCDSCIHPLPPHPARPHLAGPVRLAPPGLPSRLSTHTAFHSSTFQSSCRCLRGVVELNWWQLSWYFCRTRPLRCQHGSHGCILYRESRRVSFSSRCAS